MRRIRIVGLVAVGVLAGALATVGVNAAGAQPSPAPAAARPGLPVTVTNTPLPVTGSVNVANVPLPVQGQVSVGGTVATQSVLPASAFMVQTNPSQPSKSVGPNAATARYAISSISFVNSDSVPEAGLVDVVNGATADCVTFQQSTVSMSQRVEALPHTTVQLAFPQPLVMGAGQCLTAHGGNNTGITVVGYQLP
jgi:hypothetical protein